MEGSFLTGGCRATLKFPQFPPGAKAFALITESCICILAPCTRLTVQPLHPWRMTRLVQSHQVSSFTLRRLVAQPFFRIQVDFSRCQSPKTPKTTSPSYCITLLVDCQEKLQVLDPFLAHCRWITCQTINNDKSPPPKAQSKPRRPANSKPPQPQNAIIRQKSHTGETYRKRTWRSCASIVYFSRSVVRPRRVSSPLSTTRPSAQGRSHIASHIPNLHHIIFPLQ